MFVADRHCRPSSQWQVPNERKPNMESEGLVSPASGSKPREVLVDKGYFDEVDAQLR